MSLWLPSWVDAVTVESASWAWVLNLLRLRLRRHVGARLASIAAPVALKSIEPVAVVEGPPHPHRCLSRMSRRPCRKR